MDNFLFLTSVFPSVDIFIGFKPALKRNTKGKTIFSFYDVNDSLIGSRVLKEARGLKKLAVPSITHKIHIKSFNEDYYFADLRLMIEDCIKDKIAYVKRDYGLTPEEYYQGILESRAKAALIKEAALKIDEPKFSDDEELVVKTQYMEDFHKSIR
ncbi:MAG: hypothetical protein HCA25_04775 [Dolichospermum sp. DET50]|nr:hypothetical protein [Dolichospermum sp. DET66]MBS3031614.1 hypothetical protein [Dolichospermum sp. DET67]MBS3036825.1 hypothetical protein [Dolichospermum sp. DET50]QSX68849.1 MAG: hypothetical protein EZY12_03945 [Dolichospermum sp. DET69]